MKRFIITLAIAITLISAGLILTITETFNFRLSNKFENDPFTKRTLIYNYKTSNGITKIDTAFTKKPIIKYDDTINKGNIKIVVTYYSEFLKINNDFDKKDSGNTIYINTDENGSYQAMRKLLRYNTKSIKNKIIYNYLDAFKPSVKIMINASDKYNVEIKR